MKKWLKVCALYVLYNYCYSGDVHVLPEASRSRIDSVEIDHREFEDEGNEVHQEGVTTS